jgi:hypothetical protein
MRLRPVSVCIVTALGTFFGLASPSEGHVSLNAPDGGQVLEVGSQFTISWRIQISHNLQNWDLWYSITGPSGPWISIAQNLPAGSGAVNSVHTYNWTIPNTPSTQVRVRVRMDNSGTDYQDISNSNFTIEAAAIPGDGDGDGDVDLIDYAAYLDCETGPEISDVTIECQPFDFDGDNDVDLKDLGELQLSFTG